jgi:Glycosyl hydrolases family 43/F5/8 type C domain
MAKKALAAFMLVFAVAFLCSFRVQMPATASTPASPPAPAPATQPNGGYQTFHNDFYWVDQNGARIQTRSGCLRQFNNRFYWYGGTRGFRDQMCYSSTDLVHWTSEGVVLRLDVDANRIDVLYNDTTKQYVMFLKYNGNGAFLGIATAEKPEGPFTFKSQTLVDNARMGDMSVFEDTDGKAYLAYVSWAVGTNRQHGIYLMSPDYLTLDKRIYLWDIPSREAPHIFKRNGIYYYGTSRTAGIQSSGTSYYTATNLAGPWSPPKPLSTPGSNNSWDSQVDFVYPIQGSQGTLYMFDGDRWTKNLPEGRNGDYIWLPMEFDGDVPTVNYYQDWDLNLSTGTWRKFDPARNLAGGKTATASSAVGTNVAGNVTAPKTYQNYVKMRWESEASDPQWIMVDLGASTEINRVILKWSTDAAREFKIQLSNDSTTWMDVFSTSLGSSYSVTDVTFKMAPARYARMYGTQRSPIIAAGRGGRGRGLQAGTQPASQTAPATQPGPQGGYSLFDFQVLKD